jgi:hypothetical protein
MLDQQVADATMPLGDEQRAVARAALHAINAR